MATSQLNQFLENIDEKVLECTICFKRLKNPKSLNCLHSFCLPCLEDWVKTKGKLACPTCSKSYSIPEGGLQKLPPNTFINNLLETIDQFSKTDQMKCVCAKGHAKYYCQECREYLCSTCSDHHKLLKVLAKHKLHSVEDVKSMSSLQVASLHPPLCSLHHEPLKFFCCVCNIAICTDCAITDHSAGEGNHKPISISKAFQTFKETSAALEKLISDCKNKLQAGLKAVIQKVTDLEKNKDTSLRDIENLVQDTVKIIKKNGDKMKNEVDTIYKKKKKVLEVQMDELKTTISDINTKLSFLNQLLKSDEATAMQSSERVITSLKDRIGELPKAEPHDNGYIKFLINENQIASFQQCDIGYVSQVAAELLTLKGMESVTQGQTINVKVIKTHECEIRANQLKVTWTQPTGEINITQVQEDDNGDYFVTGKCIGQGVCKLDVSADGEPIRQSPMIIKVEKEGLVNTIKISEENIRDVIKCEDGCLLVSHLTNEILKYKQSGEYIDKITLPIGVKVFRMFKMKNGNIAFNDWGNNCIKISDMKGQVSKSIGRGILKSPTCVHVDEASNILYIGEWETGCTLMFDIDNDHMVKNESQSNQEGGVRGIIDITLTNQGHLLLNYENSKILLNNKVIVEAGDENGKVKHPRGVVVDKDDNIIISSEHKLQLFSSDGKLIKRIDKPEDGIKKPWGLFIISYSPRRVAVANYGAKNVKIFNY